MYYYFIYDDVVLTDDGYLFSLLHKIFIFYSYKFIFYGSIVLKYVFVLVSLELL
jgi:hypothetical protein